MRERRHIRGLIKPFDVGPYLPLSKGMLMVAKLYEISLLHFLYHTHVRIVLLKVGFKINLYIFLYLKIHTFRDNHEIHKVFLLLYL